MIKTIAPLLVATANAITLKDDETAQCGLTKYTADEFAKLLKEDAHITNAFIECGQDDDRCVKLGMKHKIKIRCCF